MDNDGFNCLKAVLIILDVCSFNNFIATKIVWFFREDAFETHIPK